MTILGMIMVDSFLVYTRARNEPNTKGREYYTQLAEALIDNDWDTTKSLGHLRRLKQQAEKEAVEEEEEGEGTIAASGFGIHLTPLKEKNKNGHTRQHKCVGGCGKKVTRECNMCLQYWLDGLSKRHFLCAPQNGGLCWKIHCREAHCVDV